MEANAALLLNLVEAVRSLARTALAPMDGRETLRLFNATGAALACLRAGEAAKAVHYAAAALAVPLEGPSLLSATEAASVTR